MAETCACRLQGILERIPGARLAFVGDGPAREELKSYFTGTNTVFMGMLHGEELSAAYASADVFVMPSESETLGELGIGRSAWAHLRGWRPWVTRYSWICLGSVVAGTWWTCAEMPHAKLQT